MNRLAYGIVVDAPDGDGFGSVSIGDATLRVYFQPARFSAPWPVPTPGDRCAVATAELPGDPLKAIWVIGRGAPTYAP